MGRYLSVGRVTPGVNMERSAALEIVQGAWQRLTSVITDIDDFADNLHRVAEHIKAEIDQVTPPGKRKDRLFLETESLPLRRSRRFWQVVSLPPPSGCPLLNLPVYLLERILSFLDATSILVFSRLCRYSQSISFSVFVWDEALTKARHPRPSRWISLPQGVDEHPYDFYCRKAIVSHQWKDCSFVKKEMQADNGIYGLQVDGHSSTDVYTLEKNSISQWNTDSLERVGTTNITKETTRFVMDQNYFFLADRDGVTALLRQTGKAHFKINGLLSQVNSMQVVNDSLLLGLWDGFIFVYDAISGQQQTRLSGHQYRVNDLDYDSATQILCSVSSDKTVKVWDLKENRTKPILSLRGHTKTANVVEMVCSGNVAKICTASKDGTIRLWEESFSHPQDKASRTLNVQSEVHCLRYDGDHTVVSATDDVVHVWDTRANSSNACVGELRSSSSPLTCLHLDEWRILAGTSPGVLAM